jgi:hypothetical protein
MLGSTKDDGIVSREPSNPRSVVPNLSIGAIGQLAENFLAVRQSLPIYQLVPNLSIAIDVLPSTKSSDSCHNVLPTERDV